MAPLRADTQHKTEHTQGTEPDLTLAPQPDNTRPHPMPAHFASHLLPVFPKCSQLLRLFRLLHGRLLSLQLLSNLKHKMLSAYVIRIWADRCLGCTGAGADLPSSANWGSKETWTRGPKAEHFVQDTKSIRGRT